MENEKIVAHIPNPETIPCLTCKWGKFNFLAGYCIKYDLKPSKVYYESEKCEQYEELK